MQKLFVDRIHFFKFLSSRDKPWLDQLKIITVLLLVERFSHIGTKKGTYPVLRANTKPQQLIKHTKIFCSIALLVFRKFLCFTYRNSLNWGTSKLKYSKYLENYEPCYCNTFCPECVLVYSFTGCQTSKVSLCLEDNRSSFLMDEFKIWN